MFREEEWKLKPLPSLEPSKILNYRLYDLDIVMDSFEMFKDSLSMMRGSVEEFLKICWSFTSSFQDSLPNLLIFLYLVRKRLEVPKNLGNIFGLIKVHYGP